MALPGQILRVLPGRRPLASRPPIEPVAGGRPDALRDVARALAASALAALLLGGRPLVDWAVSLPPDAATDLLLGLAEGWSAATSAVGLDGLHPALRQASEWLRGLGK